MDVKMEFAEIEFLDIAENEEYNKIANTVMKKCFEKEKLTQANMYINIIFTNPENIKQINSQYRNIEKETDVLSFPMFEKEELEARLNIKKPAIQEVLGDVIVSIERVKEQAVEYGHSFERELAYMLVHGFYHLMGYDHIEEDDKVIMRAKEEEILNELNITRE